MILSACDKPAKITKELLELSLKAVEHASKVDFGNLCSRNEQAKLYANLWPGEHYRLLAGFVLALKPKRVIEIGTSTGLSSLCLKAFLPEKSNIITFDIVPWESYPSTIFRSEDFDNRLIQYVDNLGIPAVAKEYSSLLEDADLIFIDATHDGDLEKQIFRNFSKINFKNNVFVIMDDIRVWTMLKMWREIDFPKIDLTSFGHWSGTGIVEFIPKGA